jgi:hypothetical protein
MKHNHLIPMVAGTVLLAGANASFGEEDKDKDRDQEKTVMAERVTSEKVTGSDLWDYHGNQIGTVEEVLLQPSGNAVLVIVDVKKILDEDRKLAIPWKLLAIKLKDPEKAEEREETGRESGAILKSDPDLVFSLDATKLKLKGAPRYDATTSTDPFAASSLQRIHQ